MISHGYVSHRGNSIFTRRAFCGIVVAAGAGTGAGTGVGDIGF
jgi:hypothetical protein